LDRRRGGQLVHEGGAGELADHERGRAGEDEPEPDVAHDLAAPAAGQRDRSAEGGEHAEEQHERQGFDGTGNRLRQAELLGAQDLDLRGARRQLVDKLCPGADAPGELGEQCAQVERDHPALRGDRSPAVVEDGIDQQRVGTPVGFLPCHLDSGAVQRPLGDVVGGAAQGVGRRGGERVRAGGQRLAQLAGDVDVGVQLIDEVAGDRGLDRGLLEQRRARPSPLVGLQRLAADPDGHDRQHREQAAQDHKDAGSGQANLGPRGGCRFGDRSAVARRSRCRGRAHRPSDLRRTRCSVGGC
jgi:hypothetical protein